jgi:hypothetical protein
MYKGLEVVKFQLDASVLCQHFATRIEEYHKTLKRDGDRGI